MWKKLLIFCLLSSYVSIANDLDLNDHVGSVLVLTPGKTATNVERTAIIFYLDSINENTLTIYPLIRLKALSGLSCAFLSATQISFTALNKALARALHPHELLSIHKEMFADIRKYTFAGDREGKAIAHLKEMKEKLKEEHQDQTHDADETASLRTVPSMEQLADIRNTHAGLKVPHAEDFLNIRMPLPATKTQADTPVKVRFTHSTEYSLKEGEVQKTVKALTDAAYLLSDSRPCTPVEEGPLKSANGDGGDEGSDSVEENEDEEGDDLEGYESQASATTNGEDETAALNQTAVYKEIPPNIVNQIIFEALVRYGANTNAVQTYARMRLVQLGYPSISEQEQASSQNASQGLFRLRQNSNRPISPPIGDDFHLDDSSQASSSWWPFSSCWNCN